MRWFRYDALRQETSLLGRRTNEKAALHLQILSLESDREIHYSHKPAGAVKWPYWSSLRVNLPITRSQSSQSTQFFVTDQPNHPKAKPSQAVRIANRALKTTENKSEATPIHPAEPTRGKHAAGACSLEPSQSLGFQCSRSSRSIRLKRPLACKRAVPP